MAKNAMLVVLDLATSLARRSMLATIAPKVPQLVKDGIEKTKGAVGDPVVENDVCATFKQLSAHLHWSCPLGLAAPASCEASLKAWKYLHALLFFMILRAFLLRSYFACLPWLLGYQFLSVFLPLDGKEPLLGIFAKPHLPQVPLEKCPVEFRIVGTIVLNALVQFFFLYELLWKTYWYEKIPLVGMIAYHAHAFRQPEDQWGEDSAKVDEGQRAAIKNLSAQCERLNSGSPDDKAAADAKPAADAKAAVELKAAAHAKAAADAKAAAEVHAAADAKAAADTKPTAEVNAAADDKAAADAKTAADAKANVNATDVNKASPSQAAKAMPEGYGGGAKRPLELSEQAADDLIEKPMGYGGYAPGANSRMPDALTPLQQALRSLPLEQAMDTLALMEKLTRNVVRSPGEAKFRKINLTNDKIRKAIANVPHAVALLEEMGWAQQEDSLVLPEAVRLAHEIHVVGIIDAQDYYKTLSEKERVRQMRASKAIDGDTEKMREQIEADRKEKAADGPVNRASKARRIGGS